MPRRTNPFQKLSASIMAVFYEPEYSVEESVLDWNPRTGVIRELDIRITNRANPGDRILAECRAHERKQDVQWIDALDGKARSLGFLKVVAISSSGFTKPALIEARDRRIEALHLKQAEEADWRKWLFAIDKFGVNITFDPIVRTISFGVLREWFEKVPRLIDLSRVVLLDTVRKRKIPLPAYIAGLQKDLKIASSLRSMCENDAINHFDYRVPCDPGIAFVVEPDCTVIPLVEVVFKIDYAIAEYSVLLDHMDLDGNRLLIGESVMLGRATRLVLHETPGQLKVMFEQERCEPHEK